MSHSTNVIIGSDHNIDNRSKISIGKSFEHVLDPESVSLLLEELEEARETLADWQIDDDTSPVEAVLWCLKGSCGSFALSSLSMEVEQTREALQSRLYKEGKIPLYHALQSLIWSLDAAIERINGYSPERVDTSRSELTN